MLTIVQQSYLNYVMFKRFSNGILPVLPTLDIYFARHFSIGQLDIHVEFYAVELYIIFGGVSFSTRETHH